MTGPAALPPAHPSGARPPALGPEHLPRHVAVVMDGNGRWASARGLPRVEGHRAGEAALVDVVAGAVDIGLPWLSVYAFSTENWTRSPAEVRFLMGYSRRVLRARRDLFHSWGVRVIWSGEQRRLWPSVIRELREAEALTRDNTGMVLNLCVNYGGRAEITDAVRTLARQAAIGHLDPARITEDLLAAHLRGGQRETDDAVPPAPRPIPDVDLFIRSSGEQRISNFLLWQSAYAELVFVDELWPDLDRLVLWRAIETYARRSRRFGGAPDAPVGESSGP
ncbi:MAG: di-trans,poly-cis-decaprenylcistransferase [Bifidobacteriaceae bacterium]|jgi:undecaprenyl diphosphate synthase|nr:di-trans,poly-cis-decaprenylcistransferase [Bifidobacteriaceae bacterium]